MENTLFDYSPIIDRPRVEWPNGARLAFYVGLNIEHYKMDTPSTSIFNGTTSLVPDPLNYGWRDYGPRVGIWRMIETLDQYDIPASVLLNSDVCERYPQIIEAGNARKWAWLAHGKNNCTLQAGMSAREEKAYLESVVSDIESSVGTRPIGWLGPALTETFETPRILSNLGLEYVLDWSNDDQPYALNVPGMFSVPYSIEFNDVTFFVKKSYTGPQFLQAVIDQFDQLYADSESSGRVMALCLHPFIINQPFRHKYLDQALKYITNHDEVWITTSDEIARHYASHARI